MGNKEEWEELEKWQKEQELKEQQTYKVYTKTFNEKNVKGAKTFSRIFNLVTKSISITALIIMTIIITIAALFIYYLFKRVAPVNTTKHLTQIYSGEKFEIVEDYSNTNGKGWYVLSPKSNRNIQFKAYNGGSGVKDDYSAQRLKYYIENCEDKTLLEHFKIEEKTEIYKNEELLQYNMGIEINDYNELEEKVKKIYKLVKYLNSKDKRMYESVTIINNDIDYYFSIQCYTTRTYEQELDNAKYTYINNLKEKNNQKELEKIGQQEIKEIWKPQSLLLIINGKQMKLYNDDPARVFYVQEDKKYHMSGTDVILQQIEPIEVLKMSKLTGFVKKIKYNNKKYTVKQSSSNGKSKNNVVYGGGTLEEFLEKFDSEVAYDYDNKKVYVTIK